MLKVNDRIEVVSDDIVTKGDSFLIGWEGEVIEVNENHAQKYKVRLDNNIELYFYEGELERR